MNSILSPAGRATRNARHRDVAEGADAAPAADRVCLDHPIDETPPALDQPAASGNFNSGVLVDILHELPSLGRREVDVPGGAVPAGDADREPAGAGPESGLTLGQRGQRAGFL
jgi:hypothetical protein